MELLQHLRIGAHANRLANHRLHAAIKPPQLDEFLMPSDAPFREAEMHELGWREDEVYRFRPHGFFRLQQGVRAHSRSLDQST